MKAMQGWVIERAPFRGNGFAPGESKEIIAEFKVDSARLPHGARLLRMRNDGTEEMVAVLDADGQRWLRTDGRLSRCATASWPAMHGRGVRGQPGRGKRAALPPRAGRGLHEIRAGPVRARACRPPRWTTSCYMRTTCTWRGEPFIVLGRARGWLRVEYTGGRAPVAQELGPRGVRLRRLPGLGAPEAESHEDRE